MKGNEYMNETSAAQFLKYWTAKNYIPTLQPGFRTAWTEVPNSISVLQECMLSAFQGARGSGQVIMCPFCQFPIEHSQAGAQRDSVLRLEAYSAFIEMLALEGQAMMARGSELNSRCLQHEFFNIAQRMEISISLHLVPISSEYDLSSEGLLVGRPSLQPITY